MDRNRNPSGRYQNEVPEAGDLSSRMAPEAFDPEEQDFFNQNIAAKRGDDLQVFDANLLDHPEQDDEDPSEHSEDEDEGDYVNHPMNVFEIGQSSITRSDRQVLMNQGFQMDADSEVASVSRNQGSLLLPNDDDDESEIDIHVEGPAPAESVAPAHRVQDPPIRDAGSVSETEDESGPGPASLVLVRPLDNLAELGAAIGDDWFDGMEFEGFVRQGRVVEPEPAPAKGGGLQPGRLRQGFNNQESSRPSSQADREPSAVVRASSSIGVAPSAERSAQFGRAVFNTFQSGNNPMAPLEPQPVQLPQPQQPPSRLTTVEIQSNHVIHRKGVEDCAELVAPAHHFERLSLVAQLPQCTQITVFCAVADRFKDQKKEAAISVHDDEATQQKVERGGVRLPGHETESLLDGFEKSPKSSIAIVLATPAVIATQCTFMEPAKTVEPVVFEEDVPEQHSPFQESQENELEDELVRDEAVEVEAGEEKLVEEPVLGETNANGAANDQPAEDKRSEEDLLEGGDKQVANVEIHSGKEDLFVVEEGQKLEETEATEAEEKPEEPAAEEVAAVAENPSTEEVLTEETPAKQTPEEVLLAPEEPENEPIVAGEAPAMQELSIAQKQPQAAEESPAVKNISAAYELVVTDPSSSTIHELVAEDQPVVKESSPIEEEPPAVENLVVPAEQELPPIEDLPAAQELPSDPQEVSAEQTPVEHSPVALELLVEQELPVVDDLLAANGPSVAEPTPGAKDSPSVESVPVANDVPPVELPVIVDLTSDEPLEEGYVYKLIKPSGPSSALYGPNGQLMNFPQSIEECTSEAEVKLFNKMIGWPDGVEESDSENEVAPIGDLIPMVEDIMTGKKKPKKNMMKNKQRIFCVGPLEKAPSLAKIKKKEKKKAPKKALSVPKPSANPPTKASKATNPFLNRKFRKRARAPPEPEVVMSVLVPMKGGENDDVPVAPVEKTLAPVDNGSTPSRSTSASRKPRRSCVEMLLSQAVESKIMSEDEVETIVRDARKNRSPGQGSRRSSRSTSANKSRDSSGERPESGRKSRSGRSPTKRLDLETEMDIMIAARDVRRKMTQKTKKPVSEDEADEDEILDEIPPFNEPGYEEYEFDTSMKYEIMEQMWDSFHDYMLVDNFEAVWEKDYLKNAKVPSARQARSSSRGRSKTPRKPRRSSRNAQSDIEDAEGRVTCRHTGTDFEVFKYLNTESFKKMKHNRHERIRRLRMKLEKDMAQNLPANEEHMYSVIESVRSQVMEGWVPDRSLPVIDDESFHYQWTFAKTSRASSGARKGRTPRKQAASAASTPTPTTTPRRGVRQVVSATTTPTPTSKRDRKAAPPVVTPTPEPAVGRQSRPRTRQVRSRQAAAPQAAVTPETPATEAATPQVETATPQQVSTPSPAPVSLAPAQSEVSTAKSTRAIVPVPQANGFSVEQLNRQLSENLNKQPVDSDDDSPYSNFCFDDEEIYHPGARAASTISSYTDAPVPKGGSRRAAAAAAASRTNSRNNSRCNSRAGSRANSRTASRNDGSRPGSRLDGSRPGSRNDGSRPGSRAATTTPRAPPRKSATKTSFVALPEVIPTTTSSNIHMTALPSVPDSQYVGPKTRSRSRNASRATSPQSCPATPAKGRTPRKSASAPRGVTPYHRTPSSGHQAAADAKPQTKGRGRKRAVAMVEPVVDDDDEVVVLEDDTAEPPRTQRRRSGPETSKSAADRKKTPNPRAAKRKHEADNDDTEDDDEDDEVPPRKPVKRPRLNDFDDDGYFPEGGASEDFDPNKPSTSQKAAGQANQNQYRNEGPADDDASNGTGPPDSSSGSGCGSAGGSSGGGGRQPNENNGNGNNGNNNTPRPKKQMGASILKGSQSTEENTLITLHCTFCNCRPPHRRIDAPQLKDEYFECLFCRSRIFLYRRSEVGGPLVIRPNEPHYDQQTIMFRQLGDSSAGSSVEELHPEPARNNNPSSYPSYQAPDLNSNPEGGYPSFNRPAAPSDSDPAPAAHVPSIPDDNIYVDVERDDGPGGSATEGPTPNLSSDQSELDLQGLPDVTVQISPLSEALAAIVTAAPIYQNESSTQDEAAPLEPTSQDSPSAQAAQPVSEAEVPVSSKAETRATAPAEAEDTPKSAPQQKSRGRGRGKGRR